MAPATKTLLRKLGRDGPTIPAVGFGMMGISVAYGPAPSDEDRLKLLDRAWELGCTNWDTADVYGDSEDIIGKWFALHPERRKDIFLATKFGLRVNETGIFTDSSPEYCRLALEQSLKRLQVDYVDLFYMHRATPTVPIEKTVETMKEFVTEGKVKYLGLSEVSSATLRRAHAIHPISAVQVEYNPWTLDIEQESGTHLLATCRELGASTFAYSPLGRGILTGKYRSAADFDAAGDMRAGLERYQGDNLRKNLELVDKFTEVAARKGHSVSQVVLAWVLAQGDDVFVLPGTKNPKYLEENFGAGLVELSEAEEKELRAMVTASGVSGSRNGLFETFADTAAL